jgi:hypothetical protein
VTAIPSTDPINILSEPDRQALAAQNVRTADQLTDRVMESRDFPDQFGAAAATIRNVVSGVVQQRAKNFISQSRSFTEGRVRKYWFDALVLLALLLVAVAFCRDLHAPPPAQAVIWKKTGLPPFHIIVPSDLQLSCKSNNAVAKETLEEFVGRYSPEFLEPCVSIDPKKLSSGPRLSTELNARIIVRLKVQPTSVFADMPAPFKAMLMVAPRERGTASLLLSDVFVLDLQKDTDGLAAVVAIPSADEPTLASFVARSDFFLVAGQP